MTTLLKWHAAFVPLMCCVLWQSGLDIGVSMELLCLMYMYDCNSFCFSFVVKHQMLMEKEMAVSDIIICQSVIEIILGVCNSVVDGTVTLQMLDKIEHHASNMSNLCEAITSKPRVGNNANPTESLNNGLKFTYREITMAMKQRRKEHHTFQLYYEHLRQLFTHLGGLTIEG